MKTKIKAIYYNNSPLDGLPVYRVVYATRGRVFRSYYDLPLSAKLFLAVADFKTTGAALFGRVYTIG